MIRLILWFKPFSKYLLVAIAVLIMVVSSIPKVPVMKISMGDTVIRLDYLIHFLEYGALAFLTYLTFSGKDFIISSRKYLFITVCLMAFALADEFHQIIIPGRSFNPKDIISNLIGIVGGLVFCALVFRKIVLKSSQIN